MPDLITVYAPEIAQAPPVERAAVELQRRTLELRTLNRYRLMATAAHEARRLVDYANAARAEADATPDVFRRARLRSLALAAENEARAVIEAAP